MLVAGLHRSCPINERESAQQIVGVSCLPCCYYICARTRRLCACVCITACCDGHGGRCNVPWATKGNTTIDHPTRPQGAQPSARVSQSTHILVSKMHTTCSIQARLQPEHHTHVTVSVTYTLYGVGLLKLTIIKVLKRAAREAGGLSGQKYTTSAGPPGGQPLLPSTFGGGNRMARTNHLSFIHRVAD